MAQLEQQSFFIENITIPPFRSTGEEEEIKEIRWEAPSRSKWNCFSASFNAFLLLPLPPYEISYVINVQCIHRFFFSPPPLLPDVRVQSVGIFYQSIFVSVSRWYCKGGEAPRDIELNLIKLPELESLMNNYCPENLFHFPFHLFFFFLLLLFFHSTTFPDQLFDNAICRSVANRVLWIFNFAIPRSAI